MVRTRESGFDNRMSLHFDAPFCERVKQPMFL